MYVEVYAERVREDIEKKMLISENQAGFRKERGTIDNVFLKLFSLQEFK